MDNNGAYPPVRPVRLQNHYLIHTEFTRRPYYTNIPFIAKDLERWGFRMEPFPERSLWIDQHFYSEQRRVRPILLWAREVVTHWLEQREPEEEEPSNEAQVNSLLRDFVRGLKKFGEYTSKYRESTVTERTLAPT